MNQSDINALIAQYQATQPSPAELEAFTEALVYYATHDELSGSEALQLAIDQMEVDQRQEIEGGVQGLQAFMQNVMARTRVKLDDVEWEDD